MRILQGGSARGKRVMMREGGAKNPNYGSATSQPIGQPVRTVEEIFNLRPKLPIDSSTASKVFIFQVNCLTWKANALKSTPK